MTASATLRSFAIAATAAFLAACAVGPDYHEPVAPAVGIYTERPQPERTEAAPVRGGEAQRFDVGAEISADWWTLFGSSELDELMRTALASHPTLAAAQASLRQAEENLNAQYAVLYPSVDAGLSAKRQRITGASFGNPAIPGSVFNLYNASVNVSYAIDVAGGARRELEALQASIDFQRFQLEAAYLSLTGNIATTAFREASLREQIRATRDIVDSQERQLQLVEKQFELGAISRSDVLAQRAQLAQTRANLPPLEKALAQTRNQLAVLIGKFPGEAGLPELDLSVFQLPQNLPVSLPSDLVRQRPDIRAAETVLHQTNARIGVAQALMFPQLTISGSYGVGATNTANLFDRGSLLWNIGANLLQPIFHAGQLQARKRGAQAAYDQAFAEYQQTVLGAFQNVADVLFALEFDAVALKAQADAEAAARESLEMTRAQLQFGSASYLALYNAQRQYEQAKIGLVQAQAARYADTAALFQALGGGWWSRGEQDPARPRLAN
ncbi:MAG TPA: efflux transporter outer membrane subunit [Burkholderiales bacterium]|nr:efflux transporter outer membrane subunit [Burkholderiales bacterium]